MNSRTAFYHKLFNSALIFNIAIGTTFALAFEPLYTLIGGELSSHPLTSLFTSMIGFAIVMFGFVYFQAGRRFEYDDSNFLIVLSGFAKLAFFFIMLGYTVLSNLPWEMMIVAVIDCLYGLLFIESFIYKNKYSQEYSHLKQSAS